MKKMQKKAAQGRTEPDRDKDRERWSGEKEREGLFVRGLWYLPLSFLSLVFIWLYATDLSLSHSLECSSLVVFWSREVLSQSSSFFLPFQDCFKKKKKRLFQLFWVPGVSIWILGLPYQFLQNKGEWCRWNYDRDWICSLICSSV